MGVWGPQPPSKNNVMVFHGKCLWQKFVAKVRSKCSQQMFTANAHEKFTASVRSKCLWQMFAANVRGKMFTANVLGKCSRQMIAANAHGKCSWQNVQGKGGTHNYPYGEGF